MGISAIPSPIMNRPSPSLFRSLFALLAGAAWAIPVRAQGHYQSFIVSTYATQQTMRQLMDGELDPATS